MPVDEDSNGCHESPTTAAAASIVIAPAMTKSVSYMSSTSNSSHSTTNTGEIDVGGQTTATGSAASGCLSRGDVRAPVREVHRVTFAEDRNKYLNADEQLCDGLDFELGLQLHRTSDDEDVELIPRHSIIKLPRPPSPENHENPFIADGELHRKADYIIQYSTISRRRIRIADPDCTPPSPPPPLPPDPQRNAGSPSVGETGPGDVEQLIADTVDLSPSLSDVIRPRSPTVPDGSENHDGTDRQRPRTPSPTPATGDTDVDSKTETSTTELDRPTTSLLHGGSSGNSSQARDNRCRCCAVQ